MIRRNLNRLYWSSKARGYWATALCSASKVIRLSNTTWHWRYRQRQFDAYNQVQTSDIVPIEELDPGKHDSHSSWGHFPTAPESFLELIDELDIDYRSFTFIDLGSGLGRALLLASLFPFRKVVGVEFCERLHEQAIANAKSFKNVNRRCAQIEPVHGDATTFEVPDGDLVIYLFNPFKEEILSRALEHIEHALDDESSRALIVYSRPLHHTLIDGSIRWNRVLFDEGEVEPRTAIYEFVNRPVETRSPFESKELTAV